MRSKMFPAIACAALACLTYVPDQTLPATSVTWQVVYDAPAPGDDALNDWQVVRGAWTVDAGRLVKQRADDDGVIMLRMPVVHEGVRVEYEARLRERPGDLSLILGTADGTARNSAFLGFGCDDGLRNKLTVLDMPVVVSTNAIPLSNAWHRVMALRENGSLTMTVDGVQILSGPESPQGLAGRFIAFYAWNEAEFRNIRVAVRRDDALRAYLKTPWNWLDMGWNWEALRAAPVRFEFGAFAEQMRAGASRAIMDTQARFPAGCARRPQLDRCIYGHEKFSQHMPSMVRTGQGTYLAVISGMRQTFDGPEGVIQLLRSRDGENWEKPRTIADTPLDDREPAIVALRGGGLVVTWHATDEFLGSEIAAAYPAWRRNAWREQLAAVADSRRAAARGRWLIRSDDGGATWTPAAAIPVAAPHGPAELADGRLVILGSPVGPERHALAAAESRDRGATWSLLWRGSAGRSGGIALGNAHVVETAPNRLLAMLGHDHPAGLYRSGVIDESDAHRSYGEVAARDLQPAGHLWQMQSGDGGRSWSAPVMTGIYGNWPHLLVISGATIVCTFSHHGLPFGPRAVVSHDGGVHWDTDREIVIRADCPSENPVAPTTAAMAGGRMLTMYAQPEYDLFLRKLSKHSRLFVSLWDLPPAAPPERIDPAVARSPATPATAAIERDRFSGVPFLETRDVLVGDGHGTYRIPTMVVTRRGTVLVFANRRIDTNADEAQEVDVVMRRSTDGGRTWEPPRDLFHRDNWIATIGAAIVDGSTGRVMLDYHRARRSRATFPEAADAPVPGRFMAISDDDGMTWNHATFNIVPHHSGARAYTHGCGHGITLNGGAHKGRLVYPAILPASAGEEKYRSCLLYSDDHGASWRHGAEAELLTDECAAAETGDGLILLNSRSNSSPQRQDGHRRIAVSEDGGLTFARRTVDLLLTEHVEVAMRAFNAWRPPQPAARGAFYSPIPPCQIRSRMHAGAIGAG